MLESGSRMCKVTRSNAQPPTSNLPDSRRVLFITLSNVGDAILSLPALDLVRQVRPGARVTVLAGARSAPVFAGRPEVAEAIAQVRRASWRSSLALWRRLRAARFDVVIDLRHTLWPLLLGAARRSPLLRPAPRHLVRMRERHLWRAQRALGVTASAPPPGAMAQAPDDLFAAQWLRDERVPEGALLVAISPGARSHIKRWTSAGFAAVADRLIAATRCHVLFTGEAGERDVVSGIIGRMAHPQAAHVAAGRTTLGQLAALLRRCRLLISNDSATMHLAAYLDVPVVAIFGPTDPRKYGPAGPRHRILQRRLRCVPCEASLCRYHHECMEEMTADEVFTAAREVLAASKERLEVGSRRQDV